MKIAVTITERSEVESIPTSCSKCPFSSLCDGRVAKITKGKWGMEWRKWATEKRHKNCPMVEED